MNIESVKTLFSLFSGEEATEIHMPLIELACAEVKKTLLPDADRNDIRLDFLTAALANYRLRQVKSSRDRTKVTYAGKFLADSDNECAYAEKLLRDYLQICEELIAPRIFVFCGFSDGKETISC